MKPNVCQVRLGSCWRDREYPLDGTFLYARLAPNMVAPSIFKNLENHILYRSPDLDRLGDALLDLWGAQEARHRWAEMGMWFATIGST